MNVRNAVQKYRYSLILLKELVRSDFKLRYQGSVLGYVWSLLKPLFLFVILYFVFVEVFKVSGGINSPTFARQYFEFIINKKGKIFSNSGGFG